MGTTAWSEAHYHRREKKRRAAGRTAFAYDADIRARRVQARVNPQMDPSQLRNGVRESRDSANHPQSSAIAVLLDVTGSMREVPCILQENLCTLFNLLLHRKYVTDPAILVGGIGDATCDLAPLQLGQFESGNEIEDDLGRLFLEGGGGSRLKESYELALYFLARKTAIDCHEKRGKKGFAFLIGDEPPYRRVKKAEVQQLFGDRLQADIPIRKIVAEVQEKYELFFILPNLTCHYDDPRILRTWQDLLGSERVLRLPDPAGVSELIAATVGITENVLPKRKIAKDLRDAGASGAVARAVASALAELQPPDSLRDTGLTTFD